MESPSLPACRLSTDDAFSSFAICLFTLLFLSVSGVFLSLLPSLFPLLALPFAAFLYEWTHVHSYAMTRKIRPLFDEANVLSTYQPRARTHGHLFVPDPPTPVPVGRSKASMDAFAAARHAHYEDEVGKAARMEKDLDFLAVNGASPTDYMNMTFDQIIRNRHAMRGEPVDSRSTDTDSRRSASCRSPPGDEKKEDEAPKSG